MEDVLHINNNELQQNTYTVYIHKNKINNKVYVGQTSTNVNDRWKNGNGYKKQQYFWRAIQKYGWDGFEHIIIAENLTKEKSCQMEKDLIAAYNATNPKYGYNVSIGGDSGHAGVKLSDAQRQKLSQINKGKIVSAETRKKMSDALRGRTPSKLALQKATETNNVAVMQFTKDGQYIKCYCSYAEASRQTGVNESAINACCNNREHVKSAGDFIWIKKKDYESSEDSIIFYDNEHIRPIIQLDKNGQYISEFNSCVQAQKAIGKDNSNNINACCRGDTKSAYGFIWIYKDEYDPGKEYRYKREPYANQYAVLQLDQQGNVVAEFDSVKNAHVSTGINYCSICECCNGTQKTAGGFMWKRITIK